MLPPAKASEMAYVMKTGVFGVESASGLNAKSERSDARTRGSAGKKSEWGKKKEVRGQKSYV